MKIRDLLNQLQRFIIIHPEVADAEILPVGAECWGPTNGVSISEDGLVLLTRDESDH